MSEFRVLSPTAILGYGFPESSFRQGLRRKPHCIAVDGGSTDPGPYYLGSGKSFTDRAAVKRDLKLMLKAGRELDIPVIVGTAGGSGAAPHLKWCAAIVREIAREEKLTFKLGLIPADIPRAEVLGHFRRGALTPLRSVPPATEEGIGEATHIVAQMGMPPILKALEKGCQVILCGRCYDPAVFSAPAVLAGFDAGLAMHMGKILECAAIAAQPGSGADCALGILRKDHFELSALSRERRFTPTSTAAHTLYEKSDPNRLPGPGGVIDLTECRFEDAGSGSVRVYGSRYEKADAPTLKLEAARPVGYRSISVAGIRDPIMIATIDTMLERVRKQIAARSRNRERDLARLIRFHLYGRDGVMGLIEPVRSPRPHELGLVIETRGSTQKEADALCSLTRSSLLHYGYEGRIATAGNLAFPFSPSDAPMGPVFEFCLYHLIPDDNPALFPVKASSVKGGRR